MGLKTFLQQALIVNAATPYDLTMPAATGAAGERLQTDGSGVLSWEPSSLLYVPTLADAENTTSEIDLVTATVSRAVADGDIIEIDILAGVRQDTSVSRTPTLKLTYGGVQVDVWIDAIADSGGSERFQRWSFILGRSGSDAWAGHAFPFGSWAHVMGNKLTAPTFTAGQTLLLSAVLDDPAAVYWIKPKIALVRHSHQ